MRRGMTNGWGTVAARAFSAASGAVLVVVLAGCSLGDSAQEAPSNIAPHSSDADSQPTDPSINRPHDDPPAFHFESGDLVLGDFTYEDVAGNVFNPCEEISAEEFAAIGFEAGEHSTKSRTKDVSACLMEPRRELPSLQYAVMGGSANMAAAVDQAGEVETGISSLIQGAYTYGPVGAEADICYAAVDTVRGQLSVGVGGVSNGYPRKELCGQALGILEALYKL